QRRHAGAVPAVVLPLHRAVGRDGRAVPDLQGRGLSDLQANRLDGDPRLWHGPPRRARELRRGQRAVHRLRLGHGAGADRHDPPWNSGHPAAVRERRAFPRAIRGRGRGRGGRAVIVSRRWLEALLGRTLDVRATAEQLTMHVAAVDAVLPLHQDLGDIVIARVLEVKRHPNADRLTLCLVDAGGAGGTGGPVEVVCGAPNVQAGKLYPYAPVGPSHRRTVGPTHRPTVRQPDRSVVDGVEVRLEDPEGCPRYMAAVIRGVRVGESPPWLAGRLSAVGQRPINNIVDATNYVLF